MASYGNELQTYRRFLDNFCQQLKTKKEVDEGKSAPVKLCYQYLTQSEVEGESLEWARQYLIYCACPSGLAACIARYTCDEILKKDLSHLYVISDNNQPQAIDAHELLKEVISKVQDLCVHLQGALPKFKVPDRSYKVSASAVRNRRRKMEDRHIILPDINNLFALKGYPNQSYYAIYDGHSGVEAAVYAVTHLHCNLVRSQYFATDVHRAMKSSYKITDKCFLEKCARESLRSGTTGINALIRGSTVYIGWLGDSQAVLVRNGQLINLTNPHTPEREDEKRRIEDLGGIVLLVNGVSRVNGNISVSRAIGDASQGPCISSDADVVSFELDGSEDYLVLACDGAWDCICKEQLPHLIYDHVQKNNGQCSTVAELLVKYASENGSTDNISVIVVFFKELLPDPKLALNDIIKENGENKKHDHNPNRNSGGDDSSSSQGRNIGDLNSGFRKPEKGSKFCGNEKLIPCFGGRQPCEIQISEGVTTSTISYDKNGKHIRPSRMEASRMQKRCYDCDYSPSASESNCLNLLDKKILDTSLERMHWILLDGLKRHCTQLGGQSFTDSPICGQLTCMCLQNLRKAMLSSSQVVGTCECDLCRWQKVHRLGPDAESLQSDHICAPSYTLPPTSSSSSSLDCSSLATPTSAQALFSPDVTMISSLDQFAASSLLLFLPRLCPRHVTLLTAYCSSLTCRKLLAAHSRVSPTRCLLRHPHSIATHFASSHSWVGAVKSTCPVVLSATS